MHRHFIAVILIMTVLGTTQAAEPDIDATVIERIERAVAKQQIRAVSVGVYRDGETHVRGFGVVSSKNLTSPGVDTVYEIGSISKVFTSLLAQTQVSSGKLSWDDTLGERLPSVKFASKAVAAITLRELASHSSGLPRLPTNLRPVDSGDPYKGYDRGKLVEFLEAFDPGTLHKVYEYSNLGAGLLGEIAADAAGDSFAAATKKHVLQPLNMSDTGLTLSDDLESRLAAGFNAGEDAPRWGGFDALAGAGALLSTVDDLLAFVRSNLEPGPLNAELTAIRTAQPSGDIAYGWHISTIGDRGPLYWHNGGTGGYASFLAYRPADATGVVILTASTEYDLVTELGFAQMSGDTKSLEFVELDAFPGAYMISKDFYLFISEEDDRLFAQATGQPAFSLAYASDNEFVFPAADVRIVFDTMDSDRATALTLYQGGNTTPAKRVESAVGVPNLVALDIPEEMLEAYVGAYQLTPTVQIAVELRNGKLLVRLSDQPAHPVYPYDTDRFFYKVVDAQLEFERSGGKVIAVTLHQGGKQRARRIN